MSVISLLPSRLSEPEPEVPARESLWERLDRPDSAALHGLMSGAVWFVIGTVLGLIMSNELTTPDIFAGVAQLVFSRLRPAHVNIVLFGLLSTAFSARGTSSCRACARRPSGRTGRPTCC